MEYIDDICELLELLHYEDCWDMYEHGELHISMKPFIASRDKVNSLLGSVNNWLEQDHSKYATLVGEVADFIRPYDEHDKYSPALLSFTQSVLNRKIGSTLLHEDCKSFCVMAFLTYYLYDELLMSIIQKHNIPITPREMPLYPRFDEWFEEGFFQDIAARIEREKSTSEHAENTRHVDEAKKTANWEKITRGAEDMRLRNVDFREKLIGCCEVCKAIDEVCLAEKNMLP